MPFSLSSILEVAIGLALVFYVLSLIVSYITSVVLDRLELRAKDLEIGLRDLLGDSEKMEEFFNHPWVENLRPKRLKFLRNEYVLKPIDHVPASTFALTVFDILVPGAAGKDEAEVIGELRSAIGSLPAGKAKQSLTSALNVGVSNLESARSAVEGWFDNGMSSISLLYRQHARRIAIIVTLVVTLLLGVDSIAIARNLWSEPTVRAAIAAEAERILQEAPEADVQALLSELEAFDIPIFWDPATLPKTVPDWALKAAGLGITWFAAAQGSSFWYQVLRRVRSGQ